MLHKHRHHSILECADIPALVARLYNHTYCGCCGFKAGTLVLLNDSTSGDGAQEYAVCKGGRQIESLTVSWCSKEELTAYLEKYEAEGSGEDYGPCAVKLHPEGTCQLCA